MSTVSHILSCSAVLLFVGVLPAQAQSYHVAKSVTLGGEGGWDYIAFDTPGHRLFIAHQTRVTVVDADSGAVLGEIPGLNGAHGVALAYEAGHGFASSGRDSTVTMLRITISYAERCPTPTSASCASRLNRNNRSGATARDCSRIVLSTTTRAFYRRCTSPKKLRGTCRERRCSPRCHQWRGNI